MDIKRDVPTDHQAQVPSSLTLDIDGMTCAACSSRLERVLSGVPGVVSAEVSYPAEQASIAFSPSIASVEDLSKAVRKAGFEVPLSTTHLAISGMTCASCSARIEKVLARVPEIHEVSVSLSDGRATIHAESGVINIAQIIDNIKKAGFTAEVLDDDQADAEAHRLSQYQSRRETLRLIACCLLTSPFLLQMGAMMGAPWPHLPPSLQLILASAVQVLAGSVFYGPAWRALRAGSGNMDLLVALGTTAAFGLSLYHVLAGDAGMHNLYFEASAMVLTLVLFGRWLETKAKNSVNQGLQGFAKLRPDSAWVRREHGTEPIAVPPKMVSPGDIVVVKSGERVPVDGVVVEGTSAVDQSLITGEPEPLSVGEGDVVLSGSLNGPGLLIVRTTRSGDQSTLSRLISMVRGAQAQKPAVQRLVDRVSLVFVPCVIALSILTFIGWSISGADFESAFIPAVTVLVIACPCALGLATPTAIMAGTGRAAQLGILIRDPKALEQAQGLDRVLFDKTGTLTEGLPRLIETAIFEEVQEDTVLTLAGGVSSGTTHPLSYAIITAIEERGLKPEIFSEIQTHPGLGVSGLHGGTGASVRIGSERFFQDAGLTITDPVRSQIIRLQSQALTLVFVSRDLKIIGILGFSDPLRATSKTALDGLKQRRLSPMMVTGDTVSAARAQAQKLGLGENDVIAGVLPEGKLEVVKSLQGQGLKVAMVGDGINDAPALAQADLGMAMASGADAAMETAPVALMRPDPALVAPTLDLIRATNRTIKQNLVWAFLYNVIALPLAVIGVLSPVIAGAAMALSSVSVVGNAVRLTRWRPRQ